MYSSYGSLKEMSEDGIKQIINQMLIEKLLFITKDKYALLKVMDKSEEVLNGNRTVILKEPKKNPLKEKSNTAKEKGTASQQSSVAGKRISDILNSRGLDLFECLRKLRMEIAKEESVPPYIVFSDKALADMCVKLPFNKEEMLLSIVNS